jgi:hypothetical protein
MIKTDAAIKPTKILKFIGEKIIMTEIIRVSNFLRYVLFADAATCFACGLLLTTGGAFLQSVLGLPFDLMLYAGVSLFPFAAFLIYAATRKSISKTAVGLIV